MNKQCRYQRDPAIIARLIGDEHVLVPVRTNASALNAIFALNESADLIWQQLAQPVSLADLVATFTEIYEVEASEAQHDIQATLDHLLELNLIQEVE